MTPANIGVLNLLSPFLALNTSPVGQQTLGANLAQAIVTNTGASAGQQALAISDKNLPSSASNTITGLAGSYGVAVNLGGGLAPQAAIGGITPQQPVGGLGPQLGAIYATGVNGFATGASPALANTVALLTKAYGLTSSDLGVAKNYFANGTINGTVTAVAPAGLALPSANNLPNKINSVYDLAYGVINTQPNQNIFGDSRPLQVAGARMNQFDPTALNGINTNPSFPSGHTNYAYTDSVLLGMLVPQLYQSMLSRASEYANSRIVLGVHYPLDIIASRSFSAYELAQGFTNPAFLNNAAVTGTPINLPALFTAANTELNSYLAAQCGASVATCAASAANTTNNPYVPSAANLATYTANLTYGLPTLSLAQAPHESAPAGEPDASILLATLYGGSTTAAQTLAPNGGIDGQLQTSTINQIIMNTEGNALAAFYGTSLSYWSRLNLYAAAGYFQGVTGTLSLAQGDVVSTPVTIASGGTLGGAGTLASTVVQAGGKLAPGRAASPGTAPNAPGILTINGALTFNPGATYAVVVGSTASKTQVSGAAALGNAAVNAQVVPGATVSARHTILSAGSINGTFGTLTISNAPALTGTLTYDTRNAYLTLAFDPAATGAPGNSAAVGTGINAALQSNGSLPAAYASLSGSALAQAAGEIGTTSHQATFGQMWQFLGALTGAPSGTGGPEAGTGTGSLVAYYAEPRSFLAQAPAGQAIGRQIGAEAITFRPYWTIWAQTFGGSQRIGGNLNSGTSTTVTQNVGETMGLEYRPTPATTLGAALAGGGQSYGLADAMGSGTGSFGQISVFARQSLDRFYVSAALAGGFQALTTNRTVSGAFGGNSLRGSFTGSVISGRGEAGYRVDASALDVTPYTAVQSTALLLPAYAETSTSGGGGLFALNYAAMTARDTRSELGVQLSKTFIGGTPVTLRSRLAWQHDFNTSQTAQATFVDLPGSTFTVAGARPAADAALVSLGAMLDLRNGFSVDAGFDSVFGARTQVYAGRGRLAYRW